MKTSSAAEGSATDGPNNDAAALTSPRSPRRTTFLASTDTVGSVLGGELSRLRSMPCYQQGAGVPPAGGAGTSATATSAGGTLGIPRREYSSTSPAAGQANGSGSSEPAKTPRLRLQRCGGLSPRSLPCAAVNNSETVISPRSRLQRFSALPQAAVRRSAMLSSFLAKRSLLLDEVEEEVMEREEEKEEQSFFLEAVRRAGGSYAGIYRLVRSIGAGRGRSMHGAGVALLQ